MPFRDQAHAVVGKSPLIQCGLFDGFFFRKSVNFNILPNSLLAKLSFLSSIITTGYLFITKTVAFFSFQTVSTYSR
jgi:hypothetical protein